MTGKRKRIFLFLVLSSCGSLTTDSLLVTDNSDFISSQLRLSPDAVFINEESALTATIGFAPNSNITIEEVTLIRTDDDSETELAILLDNGDPANGDSAANDNTYTALVSFAEGSPTQTSLDLWEVKAKMIITRDGDRQTAYSDADSLAMIERLSDEEWDLTLETPTLAKDYYLSLTGTEVEKAEEVAGYMETLNGVAIAGSAEDGNGVWWVYESGILGGVIFNENDSVATTKGGIRSDTKKITPLLFQSTVDVHAVQSKKALFLGPYVWQFDVEDDYYGAWQEITGSICPPFATEEVANFSEDDQLVTPEDFKNLDQYGVVVISTHGDSWYNGLFTLWTDYFGGEAADDPAKQNWLADNLSVVIMSTGYQLTDENRVDYEIDLQQHRLLVLIDGTLGMTPLFIPEYNQSMPQSIIYLSSCRSLYNFSMASAFTAMGAQAVLGYSDYVLSSYARDVGEKTFDSTDGLLNLEPDPTTIQEAFDAATLTYGESDGQDPPAFYELSGNTEANLNISAVTDGDFELGNAAGWSQFGEYFVLDNLGDVFPPEGDKMGVITTYFGDEENIEVGGLSELYQSICVPAGATTLSFQYNVVSEEAECGNDDRFDDDSFYVRVYDDAGLEIDQSPGLLESTSTSTWEVLGGDYFYGGDDYRTPGECHPGDNSRDDGTFQTGWKTVSLDVSNYAGLDFPISLSFDVSDGGDLIYDTVVCLDEVVVE